jgi:hypothetical protein
MEMKHNTVVLGLGCAWALACAMGCSDETETGGTTTSTSGTGGSSTSGTGGSSTSGTGGNTGGGGATSSSGSGGSTSSTSGTAGGGGDGGSGGGGGSPIVVDCDGSTCTATEVCCYMAGNLSCVDANQCYGMPLGCDDPGDCVSPALCCHKQAQFFCDPACGSGSGQGNIVCGSAQDCTGSATYCCPNILSSILPDTCSAQACP